MSGDVVTDDAAFRLEVREWLTAHVPAEPLPSWTERAGFDLHREWERVLYDGGYAAIDWPEEYGGRGAGLRRSIVFGEEYYRAGAPERINMGGLYLLGPVLMQHGTPEQCARWIPDILSCRTIWCQGFSEPESGSDLASLRTRAERDGDEFVVNGQKIWTSMGGYSDWIFALVRTDPVAGAARKHHGISFLCIDLRSPGVEVRPLTMVDGTQGFAEIFFTDVRVPVENVVGEIGGGWAVAMSTLGFERGAVFGDHAKYSKDVVDLARIVEARGLGDDTAALDELGRVLVQTEVYRANVYRLAELAEQGADLTSTASINKIYWTQMQFDIFDAGLRLLEEDGAVVGDPSALPGADESTLRAWANWHHRYWYARAAMIFGGTNEIQRNIISERVLGLPTESRR